MEALSYDEIAVTMDTTIPAVKSLLVRARMSLAEATQSRLLTCGEVRLELAEAAEGLRKASGPARHHVKRCEQCRDFRSQLRSNTKALAALAPIGPLALVYKGLIAKFGSGRLRYRSDRLGRRQRRDRGRHRGRRRRRCGGAGGGAAVAGAGGGVAAAGAGAGGAAVGGARRCGGAASAASRPAADRRDRRQGGGTAATAALLTAGAVEVKHIYSGTPRPGEVADASAEHPG